MTSRRQFLKEASAAIFCGSILNRTIAAQVKPMNWPLGLQLYSVRQQLAKDYAGTLKQVGSLGYREVEAAGFYQHSVAEVKDAMNAAGLRCVSSHYSYSDLHKGFDQILSFNKDLGVGAIICSSPGLPNPTDKTGVIPPAGNHVLTLDEWRWNADQFNLVGEKVAAAGLKFGYHNHTREFVKADGVVPYDELLHRTDPSKVSFELDCGWAIVAGASPIDYLRNYPQRIIMLHVKDFKLPPPGAPEQEHQVTELGLGSIDYAPILRQAAKSRKVTHLFVEQEAFDMPYMESLKTDADYMRNLKA
jgi:sugar phosphate isomerase/epimerase